MSKAVKVKLKSPVGNAPKGYEFQVIVNTGKPNGTEVATTLKKLGFKVTATPNEQSFEVI